jgi:hypothetical protein
MVKKHQHQLMQFDKSPGLDPPSIKNRKCSQSYHLGDYTPSIWLVNHTNKGMTPRIQFLVSYLEINEGNYYIFLHQMMTEMLIAITFTIKIDNNKRDFTSFAHADSSPVKATGTRLHTHGLN